MLLSPVPTGADMHFDFQTVILALLAGFVLSLVMSQVFQFVSETVDMKEDASRFVVVALMVLAGPHILANVAQKSSRLGDWPLEYIVACYGLSFIWAGALGFCVLAVLVGA